MADWIVFKNCPKQESISNSWILVFNNDNFSFYQRDMENRKYFKSSENTFIFLHGFLLPKLDSGKTTDLQHILDDFLNNGEEFIKNYKGDFVLLIIHRGKLIIYSDYFGVGKYFYTTDGDGFIASNRLSVFSDLIDLTLNQRNVYLYFLLNYLPYETTFFNGLNKNIGGNYIVVNNKGTSENQYFDIIEFLRNRKPLKLKDKELFQLASENWMLLIEQYLNYTGNSKIAMTLTAGLDSRLILAAMQKLGVNPITFTFGRKDSMDVRYAKIIAKKSLNLDTFQLSSLTFRLRSHDAGTF